MSSAAVRNLELAQERARDARREAEYLRDLYGTATCGLPMKYGTRTVPKHIGMRVAAQFPIWADEYDAIADKIDADIEARLS